MTDAVSRVRLPTEPIVQLGSRDTVVRATAAELDELQARFALQDYVRLPQLLAPDLLERVLHSIEEGVFEDNRHKDIALELRLSADNRAAVMLQFVANSPKFFQVVSRITECGPIGSFMGRVNRRLAELGHFDNWHSDNVHGRLAAMTLNLGQEHRGGEVELRQRDASSGEVIPNPRLGDALVFRIGREYRHRIRPVEGRVPRTVFAGWFCETPNFMERLRDTKAPTQCAEDHAVTSALDT
jgi:hypothetical protein